MTVEDGIEKTRAPEKLPCETGRGKRGQAWQDQLGQQGDKRQRALQTSVGYLLGHA